MTVMDRFSLDGKVAIVTGASSGLGVAFAKGLAEAAVVSKHAARPAAIPVVTVIGLAWGQFMAGSFLVEYVFALPGLGRMGVDAIFA